MQSVAILALLAAGNAAAFAPAVGSWSSSPSAAAALHMSDATPVPAPAPIDIDIEAEDISSPPAYPTVNGWTADPAAFCFGLPGALAPMGNFDPLGLSKDLPVQEVKRYREAEVTHGRVAMLATVGYLVAEPFHPLFDGAIGGPANTHLTQLREVAPAFFVWLAVAIFAAEIGRANYGWTRPGAAMEENRELDYDGKTFLTKLNDGYYPGDVGFDPLGLKPSDPKAFAKMQTKELQNGRLAMLAAMGMIAQEQISHATLF